MKPGDYPLTASLLDPGQITIHGVAGQPRPRLLFSGVSQSGLLLAHNSLVRHLEIDQAAPKAALFSSPGKLDQVIVKGSGGTPCATFVNNSVIRDSIVIAPGSNQSAICAGSLGGTVTTAIRNVTAIATGSGGVAIHADAIFPTGKTTFNLVNVIARGGPGGADLEATGDNSGAQATIVATRSNYGTEAVGANADITSGGGNQLFQTPLFVNAAAGDYRQAPGSPTIDAGVDEPINGAFDVDGDPRRIATTDIGADEFIIAPAATTGPAGAVTGHSATLNGSVTANGIASSYHFEYGRTIASATPTPPPATTPPATATPGFAGVTLVSPRLPLAGSYITLKLRCATGTVGRCSGRAKLTVRDPRTRARLTLGRGAFSIAPGTRAKVTVRVSRPDQRRLRGVRRLRGKDINVARDGAGASKTTKAAVKIRHRIRSKS